MSTYTVTFVKFVHALDVDVFLLPHASVLRLCALARVHVCAPMRLNAYVCVCASAFKCSYADHAWLMD